MRLEEATTKLSRFSPPAIPELRYIKAATQRVHDRWPDVSAELDSREREQLAIKLRDRVAQNDWSDARLSFVLAAARAVLDTERQEREDLEQVRTFLYDEVRASRSETFLSGMLAAHLESFAEGAKHTRSLAQALDAARSRMNLSSQQLLVEVPEILVASDGPQRLAVRMARMSEPFLELARSGLRDPHGPGFMERVHEALSAIVRPDLVSRDRVDWFLRWLQPPGRVARTSGAEQAIEALTHPWRETAPSDQLRSHLVESLIEMYGDPRIRAGGVWAGVDPTSMRVIHRWLTREDMRFFTGVVDAAQQDAMWPPRRDFWLTLYDEGVIDAAWVAFSSRAAAYAREHLMRQEARNADSRFGFQQARQNTSLLIMKIGNKIVVDGCHNYRTHIFNESDPMAPPLFQEGYDCDEIMRRAPASKSHSSIPAWGRWVRDTVNADVPFSRINRPYPKVLRPAMPRPTASNRGYGDGLYSATSTRPDEALQTLRGRTDEVRPERGTAALRFATNHASAWPGPIGRKDESPTAKHHAGPGGSLGSSREVQFRTLTDRLIAHGPEGAAAVLALSSQAADGRPGLLLSPKAKEGLEWLRAGRGIPPLRLHNALEHLLMSLKKGGWDLDALFSERKTPEAAATASPQPSEAFLGVHETAEPLAADLPPTLPRLPESAAGRLELLRRYADQLEEIASKERDPSRRATLGVAVKKLKARSPFLRPAEIADLQQLYELIRGKKKAERR